MYVKKGSNSSIHVEISIKGDEEDEKVNFFKSKTFNNGFNPVWNESVTFNVKDWNSGMLVFQVLESLALGVERIGFYSLSLSSIRNGVRVVPMRN